MPSARPLGFAPTNPPAEAAASPATIQPGDAEAILRHFRTDTVPKHPLGLTYRMAMAAVALTMLLLPAIYLLLVGAATWCVYWWATHGLIIIPVRNIKVILLAYCGPLFAGVALLVALVKPLLSRPKRGPEPVLITREDEPAVWALVERICRILGAPVPRTIAVDCEVNASAGFEPGLLAFVFGRLRLTIGLPLVTGMSLQQLTGVLAHEFGHFAQGGGMRLSNIIRRVSAWFARVVYERDSWDEFVQGTANQGGWISLIGYLAQAFVWLGRRILWCMMWTGHVISSYLLRQMEFDADSCEARLCGSAAFAKTHDRIVHLSVGANQTWNLVGEHFQAGRLPRDIPALIASAARRLPAEIRARIDEAGEKEETGLFDTHPSGKARKAAAARLDAPGIFQTDEPATVLFQNLAAVTHTATRHHYTVLAGVQLQRIALVDNREIEGHDEVRQERHRRAATFLGSLPPSAIPLDLPETPPSADLASATAAAESHAACVARLRPDLEAWAEAQASVERQSVAELLLAARFVDTGRQVPDTAHVHGHASALDELKARRERRDALGPPLQELGRSASAALGLAASVSMQSPQRPVGAADPQAGWSLLRALAAHSPLALRAREMAIRMHPLLQQIATHQQHDMTHAIHVATLAVRGLAEEVGKAVLPFSTHPCPFPEMPAGATMKDYLQHEHDSAAHPLVNALQCVARFADRHEDALARLLGDFVVVVPTASAPPR
ncbi:MAG: M48 family metallopeptidase [Opitutaceae bacterium]|nr:M48 family metallopeptidase [Opitutaceae bacterium]